MSGSAEVRRRMLDDIGVSDFEDLVKSIPVSLRLKRPLNLPPALSEPELESIVRAKSGENVPIEADFTGGGAYDHFVPAVIDHILLRSEYYTAYTPYQAEAAQGTLQTMYEFQTFISRLTGMAVTSASLYDGASALAEAVSMAVNQTGRKEVLISRGVNPVFIETARTYLSGRDVVIRQAGISEGVTDFDELRKKTTARTAAVILQTPNFFGLVERPGEVSEDIRARGALLVSVYDPLSLGILAPPADYEADIAVAEGQSLGIALNYGGPYLGLLSTRREFLRKMPGRLAGRTEDRDGRVGYVMTLQTREQHIRRERATSNICTNQALCALAATVYMSLIGVSGLQRIGGLCLSKAHYAADRISAIPGFSLKFAAPFFKEFVVATPIPPHRLITGMMKKGIAPGIDMGRFRMGLKGCLMIAVTEKRTKRQIDDLVFELSKAAG
jgi:glycine dehydrogenase subunit 1